ncbi:hypothetical protein [Sphingosinicella sp. BN140058]|uniref:hypothetical protein n=1 Tax=Sphingosinicella sp. BN140058 TaxID=1892855 RepID=UPI0010116821|nr:hypothetical protein [Sphingosinicella sp. BN140058]QAY79397.1 hypothetical protein ETR14_24790 [Sphingosinicella sp. BN140058]
MFHFTAAALFTLVLLAACMIGHMTVRNSWAEIMAALRGELGREIRRSAALAGAPRRRAAA